MVMYVFSTRHILNFLINFITATYFSKARYSLFVLKVPLHPNESTEHCPFASTNIHYVETEKHVYERLDQRYTQLCSD